MMSELNHWLMMKRPFKEFVLRVESGGGAKHSAEPHFTDCDKQIPLWKMPEALGFIKCTGSYRWVVTDKFKSIKELLFLK